MAATIDHSATAGSVVVMEKTDKRDFLIDIEKSAQSSWQSSRIFDANAPPLPEGVPSYAEFFATNQSMSDVHAKHPKWFGTFPYAYMNGSLHLGHAFTISKIEFAAGFERMRGRMFCSPLDTMPQECPSRQVLACGHADPIQASADKLIREMEMFGEDFSGFSAADATVEPEIPTPTPAKSLESVDPSKAKKGKLNAKSTGLTYQFQILELIGVPREEIKRFADPHHWLHFFPPIAKEDLNSLGARVDWRRQFLTTDANPYYDSFVRWQMNKLHAQGKIKFGERYTVYSPKDGQPCMDHDRQSGEAVNPQEYTGVKLEVLEWGKGVSGDVLQAIGGRKVFMTNCFVGPKLTYGIYEASDSELFLITDRAARNMAFQGTFDFDRGIYRNVIDISGADLIGTKVRPAFGLVEEVYVLPMEGVLATKGTGVVTSVPSDSPDDYRTLLDLRKKPEMYKIDPSWAAVDPIPVLSTPKYGDMAAETLCAQLKIQSQRDVKQLAEAKDLAYKEGFYNGVMLVGDFKGQTVAEAKPQVRQQMIDRGVAIPYAEPESEVISRSADVCVVALVDQWYLDYGEDEWKGVAKKLLERMNTYLPETRNAFEAVLDWLNQWACARSYGLGSRLPWDPQFLVESLSDSTIYMSYYTVAHLLHQDMWGGKPGSLGITPDQMTDAVWEYVLGSGDLPADSPVPVEKAAELKYAFQYFYPLDIRSSGKDLIPNHLTFWIYNHAALFPEHHWPRAVRTNGHLMLNGKKMSKSTGNFLTMREATRKYGADAMRLSLADAGDDITDANFEETVANAAILRLHTACMWAEEIKAAESTLRTGAFNDFDRGFRTEMDALIQGAYDAFDKWGLYDFENARNWYRTICAPENGGPGMHHDLVFDWVRANALLMAPFTPHFSEHIWQTILGEKSSVQSAAFPTPSGPIDAAVLGQLEYMRGVVDSIRSAEALVSRRKGGKQKAPTPSYDPSKPKQARIYVASDFPEWQNKSVQLVREAWDEASNTIDEAKLRSSLDAAGLNKDKRAMPFCQLFKRKVLATGPSAFNRSLPFSELDTLSLLRPLIKASLKYGECYVTSVDEANTILGTEGEKEGWSKERAEANSKHFER
ncbi:cytosolic leucyl tRNA synthetase [Saitozyma podzolica]|uniref:leucine--tRNA ligase n=1 Tax=Saitozyma podzolica TaxID=1890683 RepID=A0A427YPM8_9TREE|nr:cytosolic leucyl tRNA synthetase [Saitozyma podzolica]